MAGRSGPLHVLINNAGIMALPDRQLSPQGFELQFAKNGYVESFNGRMRYQAVRL